MKTGLSLFDLTAGLHGVIGILAALNNKHNTGLGQHVDISMLDVAVALLANQGMNYLAKKQRQKRVGNNHPNVVPYQVMPAKDGHWTTHIRFYKTVHSPHHRDPKTSSAVS